MCQRFSMYGNVFVCTMRWHLFRLMDSIAGGWPCLFSVCVCVPGRCSPCLHVALVGGCVREEA